LIASYSSSRLVGTWPLSAAWISLMSRSIGVRTLSRAACAAHPGSRAGQLYTRDVGSADHPISAGTTVRTRPSRLWAWTLAGVVVLLVVTIGLVRYTEWGTSSSNSSAGFTCMAWGTSKKTEDYCDRAAADAARRLPLSDAQRSTAETASSDVGHVVGRVGRCVTAQGQPCNGSITRHQPTAADANAVVQALKEAGHNDSTARVAGSTDPAPADSLLYAVDVGDGVCIIGYIFDIPGGAGGRTVLGRLPGGRCLDS
jgi:hypothetical protein